MYRPNRIGPWPLVDIDAAIVTVADTTLEAGLLTIASPPEIYVNGATVNTQSRADNFLVSGSLGITTGTGIGLGVQVDGSPLVDVRDYQVSVSGCCKFHSSQLYGGAQFVFGRADAVASGIIGVTPPVFLAPDVIINPGIASAFQVIGINKSFIVGDFLPSGSEGSNPLVFGVWLMNGGASTSEFTHVRASLSIDRYVSDIPTFDPNR